MTIKKTKIEGHELVPVHEKLSEQEKQKLLANLGINFRDLPKIHKDDPVISQDESLKTGEVIKITRKSSTAKETVFYRGVIDA